MDASQTYKTNSTVYVLVVDGDFSKDKLIIGHYTNSNSA
jgi:hypothetical protein